MHSHRPAAPTWLPPAFDPGRQRLGRHRRGRAATYHVDLVLAELGDRQHGVVGRRQALALAVTPGEIEARLRSGALFPVRRGVYAVGRPTVTAPGRRMAAVLAAGHGARLGGWSGATQRGLLPEAGTRIDVCIPPGRRVVLPGVAVRRVTASPDEWTVADGVPTHTVPRLLLDLATAHDREIVEWAWRQAIFRQGLDVGAIDRLLRDRRGSPGTPILRELRQRRTALVGELRNAFELLMLSIIREAALPEPLVNAPLDVGDGIVLHPDFRIPQLGLVVESDGQDGHGDVEFLLTDAERDRRYGALGYRTLRYGYWEAKRERGRVVAALGRHARGSDRRIVVT